MKYLKTYKIFESKSSLKFVKQPTKKDAKTETYNVVKDDEVIGQIKWSSRMRGYSFLPEKQHDDEIKTFIKNLMCKRKNSKLKTNESNQYSKAYSKVLKEFESKQNTIQTINDILLPISDLGYKISINDSPISDWHLYTDEVGYKLVIKVVKYTDKPLVITDEIKEYFITMNEYLESEGFSTIEAHYVRGLNPFKNSFNEFIKNLVPNATDSNSLRNLLFTAKKIESE